MIDQVGPVLAKYLISYCGGVEEVFAASKKELAQVPNVGPATIDKIKNADVFDRADKQLAPERLQIEELSSVKK